MAPDFRRLEAVSGAMVRHVATVLITAVRGAWPAVIAAVMDEVDLVAALRPHLHLPQPPARIDGESQQVAVAQRPDLRRDADPTCEWIVGGQRAVVVQPDDLAEIDVQVLRGRELEALARADVELA